LRRAPRDVLIGGLGMGYTLRAALDLAGPDARIVAAELVPAVVEWVGGPLADLADNPLADLRVEVRIGSVAKTLAASPQRFDVILLDTDNGPESVLHPANAFLYSREGIELAMRALKDEGVAGFWSADRSTAFEVTIDQAGRRWRRVEVAACDDGPEHTLYLVRRGG
jgi:spermidine synthase